MNPVFKDIYQPSDVSISPFDVLIDFPLPPRDKTTTMVYKREQIEKTSLTLSEVNEQMYAVEMFPIITSIPDSPIRVIAINVVCNRYSWKDTPERAKRVSSDYGLGPAFPAVIDQEERTLLKGMISSKHIM